MIENIAKAFRDGYFRYGWLYQRPDGTLIPTEITLVRVRYKDGYIVAGYARDMREHNKMISELESAFKQATEASRAKSDFLAKMSHEIRTPMNSIIGFSELAIAEDIPYKARKYLDIILENSELMLSIINSILDIAKIESGKMTFNNELFFLDEVVEYCKSTILPIAHKKGISLLFYTEQTAGQELLGDPFKLRQILINLLNNAVKFTKEGTVKLKTKITKRDNDKIAVCFKVVDTGIGLKPEQIEMIFKPFIQADNSIEREYGGTGLGITITNSLLELMGSKLYVESEAGKGSQFWFEIDFHAADKNVKNIKNTNNFLEKPYFNAEILVCEDNEMNQNLIIDHLAMVGIKTTIAENGLIGLKIVEKHIKNGLKPFDLIFMDIQMPVMNGLTAAKKITELGVSTPIVALTANIMDNDLSHYNANGIIDHLGKPFKTNELWTCLLRYITPVSIEDLDRDQLESKESDLLKKLKLNFVKSNTNIVNDFIKALEENDLQLAERIVHTLKSNAGQIGEVSLQTIARSIEITLRNGDLVTKNHKINLEKEVNKVLSKLTNIVEKTTKIKDDKITDKNKIKEILDKLEIMLINYNPECVTMTDELMSIEGTEELVLHIEDYEFKEALETLQKIKHHL
jgi:signal transduction histidine kinase/CheY-like chemotaxis protein